MAVRRWWVVALIGCACVYSRGLDADEGGGVEVCAGDDCPIVYYAFNECGSVTPDLMGTGLDLVLDAGSCDWGGGLGDALGQKWASGTALRCPNFPYECAHAFDDPVFEPEQFSISAWVYSEDWNLCGEGNGEYCTIVSKGNTDERSNGYWLHVEPGSNHRLRFMVAAGGPESEAEVVGGSLHSGVWHHVVGTFDGVFAAIYLDGLQVGKVETAGISYGDEDFLVGNLTDRDFSHRGWIEEVKLWDHAKDEAQVAALHTAYVGE